MGILQEPLLGHNPTEVSHSNSEIQTFKSCRRQWFLGYYLGLKPKKAELIGPLPLGTRVHDALEVYYTTGEHPSDVYNRLQRLDNRKFLETDDAGFEDRVDKFNKESDLGRIMVEGYKEWADETNVDAGIIIEAAEQILSHELEEFPGVKLIGKIDVKARRPLGLSRAVMDHKTAVTFTPYEEFASMTEQLQMYSMLERLDPTDDTPLDGGIYNLLKKVKRTSTAKPPFYKRIDVRFNKHQLDAFWLKTLGVVGDMTAVRERLDAGMDHRMVAYPRPQMDWRCGKCPFFKVCTMLDDGSMAEEYLADFYSQVDPNARYGDDAEAILN